MHWANANSVSILNMVFFWLVLMLRKSSSLGRYSQAGATKKMLLYRSVFRLFCFKTVILILKNF